MNTLAIDPSLTSSGFAYFEGATLVETRRITARGSDDCKAVRAAQMAARILERAAGYRVTTLVVEWPQIYRATRSKSNPNDLLGLAAIAGILASALQHARVRTPTPAEWIGQLPKATRGNAMSSPRALRIMSRLTSSECVLVLNQHDVIDAVGLALWSMGRLSPRRIYGPTPKENGLLER